MGTVGLSFGSPTSGTGFDVSATVSTIVANLQKVESPWKTQLTAYQSQDTALSSIGTLLSSLYNDLTALTDFTGVLAQKTGASSNTNVLQLTAASTAAIAGTHTVVVNNLAQTSSGYMDAVTSASDTLAGSLSIQVNGTTQPFDVSKLTTKTLSGLAAAINSSGMGVTASVLTDASGSRLSLVSGTSGENGQITVTSTLTDAAMATPSNPTGGLSYNPTVDGKNASLVVDGVPLSSATNIVSNLISGVTFQILSASPVDSSGKAAGIQVVIGNDNASAESTINTMVSDYNSLITAMRTQEGNDSTGKPEPLFGSPTMSLLQQQLLGGINMQNPSGYMDSITSAGDSLSGSIDISLAGGLQLFYSGTAGTDSQPSNGTLSPITHVTDTLSGSITIAVGGGASRTIKVGDSSTPSTLDGLVQAVNAAGAGVNASVVTNSDGSSSLSLVSGTSGTAGTLTVTSRVVDTSTQTVAVPTSDGNNTLAGLADAINSSHSGVTASVKTDASGSRLVLVSGTAGTAGKVKVTSALNDDTTGVTLNYNDGGTDLSGLGNLGISMNNDGSISLDVASLGHVLNSDFSGVLSFFQNANSWGKTFTNTLFHAGSMSSTGVLKLAQNANSTMEANLNTYISKQESLISLQQKSLTAELISANEILQSLPSQLNGVNEIYSAISGYNRNSNG